MAKSKVSKTKAQTPSNALVIVESPAKARTISKFLGRGFTVEASIGHVRDLPQGAKQIPAEFKGEPWSNLGVNVNDKFTPIYIIPPGKSKQIKLLKDRLKSADALYLATDEDREGEAISWHLLEILKPKVPVHRLVFHEITKDAIQQALASPRSVDDGLVRAQETRRILDRLYGYEVSPLLWRKVRPKLSAGRVQSVAVRMIVERERERMAFVSATWWDLIGKFAKSNGQTIASERWSRSMAAASRSGKDFDPSTGKLKDQRADAARWRSPQLRLAERIKKRPIPRCERRGEALHVQARTRRLPPARCSRKPIASSASQLAARCRWPKACTRTATSLTCVPIRPTWPRWRSTMRAGWWPKNTATEYLPAEQRAYKSKVKNAQEAHEGIRPGRSSV